MTRLIDADALNREIDKVECYSRDPYVTYMSECIANAPTVDAVPVEFIKGEIKNNKGFYNSSLRRLLDAWAERKEE